MAVAVTGTYMAGSSLSLLCTVTPPIPLVTSPTVSWLSVVESDGVTVTSNLAVSQSTVTVTFDPLTTSQGRVYVCVAGYNIPEANLPNLNTTASTTVAVQSKLISVSFQYPLFYFPQSPDLMQ